MSGSPNIQNEKLRRRVIRIVREILACEEDEAIARLEKNDWNIRKAVTLDEAETL